jgi:hypothetical protein
MRRTYYPSPGEMDWFLAASPPLAGNSLLFAEKSATSSILPLILTPWNVKHTWREMRS